jgi:ArsR family transcriptional regulator
MPDRIQDYKAEFFRTIGHPARIRILTLLRERSMSVGEIQEHLGLQSSNVSQHLALLRGQRIVDAQREGAKVLYSASDRQIYEILDAARAMLERRIGVSARVFESERETTPLKGVDVKLS